MRFALINPDWNFEGSVYFGCREPHFPIELGYAKALLEASGHEALLIDGHMEGLTDIQIRERAQGFRPDWIVVLSAPGYLFWRCPQPELKVPIRLIKELRKTGALIAVAGPHGSATPGAVFKKVKPDAVILGEPERTILSLAEAMDGWKGSEFVFHAGLKRASAKRFETSMESLPPLMWDLDYIRLHKHHHHRFNSEPHGLGAEVEASRGCPYMCTFCAKSYFRNRYRKRPVETVLAEVDHLVSNGVGYIYFIDEIFLPDRRLLEELRSRGISFGVQTRIDLWNRDMLELLASTGCVSLEAGVESISEEGRAHLGKRCAMTTEEITGLLIHAGKGIKFVQATLMDSKADRHEAVERWRKRLYARGVWANRPVPMFPYPGSGEYERLWGQPDHMAWERAHAHYLRTFKSFSDIQDERPLKIEALENGE